METELSDIEARIIAVLAKGGSWQKRHLPGDEFEHLDGPDGLVSRGLVKFAGYNDGQEYYTLPEVDRLTAENLELKRQIRGLLRLTPRVVSSNGKYLYKCHYCGKETDCSIHDFPKFEAHSQDCAFLAVAIKLDELGG